MNKHVAVEESFMLGMKNKDLVDYINSRQQQVKGNNNELLDRLKQSLEAKAPNYT